MASNFGRAIPVLAELTAFPVFVMMKATDVALPLQIGVGKEALAAAPNGKKKLVRTAMWRLAKSKRYLEAQLLTGAMRHDRDGQPVSPVSTEQRVWARAKLAEQQEKNREAKESRARSGPERQPVDAKAAG